MNSNMDNLEFLSDSELRLRLIQFGFPNLPVTATTRKLLIKKLRMHTENQKSQLRRETSYATRYSSGEESDNNEIKKRKNQRATVSGIPQTTRMAPPATTVRPPKRSVFAGTPPRNERVITPVRYTNISASESEEETDNNNSRQSPARISPYSSITSRLSNQNSPAADYIDSIIRKRYPNSSPTSSYTPPSTASPPLRDTTNTNGHRSFESDRTGTAFYFFFILNRNWFKAVFLINYASRR